MKKIREEEVNRPSDRLAAFTGFGIWGRGIADVEFCTLCDWILCRISCLECLAGHYSVDLCAIGQLNLQNKIPRLACENVLECKLDIACIERRRFDE